MFGRAVFAGVFGLLLAGTAVIGARLSLLSDAPVDPSAMGATVEVYVAAAPIGFGQPVTEDLVVTQTWPRALVPHLAITDPTLLLGTEDGPRRAKGHFVAGEVILASKLAAFGIETTAISPTDPAQRALALRIEGEAVAGGLISPGDLIDLYFADGSGLDRRVVTLMQAVRVLGIGSVDPARGGLITVEVAPDDGQALALAQTSGTLVAALHLGGSSGPPEALDLRTLLGAPSGSPAKASSVIVRRAGTISPDPAANR